MKTSKFEKCVFSYNSDLSGTVIIGTTNDDDQYTEVRVPFETLAKFVFSKVWEKVRENSSQMFENMRDSSMDDDAIHNVERQLEFYKSCLVMIRKICSDILKLH